MSWYEYIVWPIEGGRPVTSRNEDFPWPSMLGMGEDVRIQQIDH